MFEKNAIINFNKPTGMSSFLAVKKVAKILGVKKAGHMGTLDPYGCGVLLIGVNKGTKLFDEYLKKNKTYRTIFHFGCETDTLDSEGQIVSKNDKVISEDEIRAIIPKFIGKQSQMPPNFSAKKINGKRACDLVRMGKEVELKPKEIEIFDIKLINALGNNNFMFDITCSAGCYIRSICRDIAKSLSTYGTMLCIIRTKCGIFDIKNSCTINDLSENRISFVEV